MINRNLLANYVGTAFVAATQILVIPLYIGYLGERDWGLLSSLLALAAALLILEAGVSQAVARGISERNIDGPLINRRRFESVERKYLSITLGFAVAASLLAEQLGAFLLPQGGTKSHVFALLAIAMSGSQIVGSLYRGVLIGRGAQVRLNGLLIVACWLRHILGVTVASRGDGVVAVAVAIAASFVVEAVLRRWLIAGLLSPQHASAGTASVEQELPAGRGAIVLAAAGTVGALATQFDRLFLGTLISSVDLGRYAIAATLSLAVLQLIYPISNSLLPRLSEFKDLAKRDGLFGRAYLMLFAILVPVWGGAVLFASEGLHRWLPRDAVAADAASSVQPLLLIHLIGTSLNALCVPLHMAMLASHLDERILIANLAAALVLAGALTFLTPRYGAIAGSIAWSFSNAALLGLYFALHKPSNKRI